MLYKHYLLVFAPSLSDDKRINTLILHAGFYNLKKQSDVQKQRKPRFRQFLHSSACVWLVQPKPSAPWIQLHPETHATAFYTELLEMEAGGDDTSPWDRAGPVTALSCCRNQRRLQGGIGPRWAQNTGRTNRRWVCARWLQHFTALFKYASKAFREIVHIFNMQEYKPNTAILPT